jgi:hypothetical protein
MDGANVLAHAREQADVCPHMRDGDEGRPVRMTWHAKHDVVGRNPRPGKTPNDNSPIVVSRLRWVEIARSTRS